MNVNWTQSALADLRAVHSRIARSSKPYAQSMVERIFNRTAILANYPFFGPEVAEYQDEMIRELFEDPYRIIYRLLEDRVDIVAVVHGARRLRRKL